MRGVLVGASAGAVALALAVPASAGTPTLEFIKWRVVTDSGNYKVGRGQTYEHCRANRVNGIDARGIVSGAHKGDAYKAIWRLNGQKIVTFTRHWPKGDGKVKVATLSNSASDLPDGKYKLTVRQNGKVLGSDTITLKTKKKGC